MTGAPVKFLVPDGIEVFCGGNNELRGLRLEKSQTLMQAMTSLPKTLYHYTSMSGLLGIVRTEQIWASHIRYLNDVSEQDHIWSLVRARVAERLAQATERTVKVRLEELLAAVDQRRVEDIYVASFSADGDLLSQWLSYCPQGNGFAIGFSTRSMSTNVMAQTKKMGDLAASGAKFDMGKSGALFRVFYYSTSDHSPEYNPVIIDALIDVFTGARLLPQAARESIEAAAGTFGEASPLRAFFTPPNLAFFQLSFLECIVKNASFSAEKECRLVLRGQPQDLSFRPGRSMLIPYTKYPLDLGDEYFIERIIIGPGPQPDLALRSVKMLFESVGHPSVEVVKSAIPYRAL